MKIVFTKHALKKKEILRELGWNISLNLVQEVIRSPELTSETKYKQPTAIKILDEIHLLRVVYEDSGGIITVITFHISRKGRYGT